MSSIHVLLESNITLPGSTTCLQKYSGSKPGPWHKGGKSKWRAACDEYWKPGGCSQGHQLSQVSSKATARQMCNLWLHSSLYLLNAQSSEAESQDAEWDESTWQRTMMSIGKRLNGRLKSMKRPRARKEKAKDLSLKRSPKARMRQDLLLQGHRRLHLREVIDPNPKPNRGALMHDK